MSKLDDTWAAFDEARTKLRDASAAVREHTVDLAANTAALAAAKEKEVRAARNLKAAAAKVPGLLYAEVSGMCGGVLGPGGAPGTDAPEDGAGAPDAPTA